MIELIQKKQKTNINLIRKKKVPITPIITDSITRYNDPYMPHIKTQSTPCLSSNRQVHDTLNSSTSRLTIPITKSQEIHHHHHHHHHFYYLNNNHSCPNSPISDQPYINTPSTPPLSPPPLSPNLTKPSWRNSRRSWQPAPSISEDEEDDNQPIGLHLFKTDSLLSDSSEDGDDDLIPIAGLLSLNISCMSAAEKYKAKVKARLF